MQRFLLGFILTLTILGCKKDDAPKSNPELDYSSFLAQTGQTFRGRFNGNYFLWSFGLNQFQAGYGYVGTPTDSLRAVEFGLTSHDGETWFRLYSPKYNSASESEFLRVFGLGKKKLGDYLSDFHIELSTNKDVYQTNSLSDTNEIEILKTQEFTDLAKLRVWFRIEAKLFALNKNIALTDGLMIAEFYGFKK